jgi:hypothetical protein
MIMTEITDITERNDEKDGCCNNTMVNVKANQQYFIAVSPGGWRWRS